MVESWGRPRRTSWAKRRPRLRSAVGVTAPPAGLGQLRDTRVADAAGVHAYRRPPKRLRMGEEVTGRRSPQAAACRQSDVEARGRPPRLLAAGHAAAGSTAHAAPQGTPGHRTLRAPPRPEGTLRQAGWGRPLQGNARRRPLGRRLTPRTRSVGPPRPGGRPCRQEAARTGHGRRTPADRTHARPPRGGGAPPRRPPTRRPEVGTWTGA